MTLVRLALAGASLVSLGLTLGKQHFSFATQGNKLLIVFSNQLKPDFDQVLSTILTYSSFHTNPSSLKYLFVQYRSTLQKISYNRIYIRNFSYYL